MERRLNDWFIILRSHYDNNKTQRSTRGKWGEIVIGSPFLWAIIGSSGKVGVVMSRSGVNGLMCGSSKQ